ncbi:hypothetical protein D3C75_1232420 [compost metagenome]
MADVVGGTRGACGQAAHFVGHHREATAMLPGTRRLDSGIERQQVGLVGDFADQPGDVVDLDHAAVEPLHAG